MKCLRYIFLFGIIILLFSCKKFKGSQEIPAYLRIEPWTLTTNYEVEGAATQAITDAWVYVDGNLHGCFELKNHNDGKYVLIPILENGSHQLQIYPGVKMNGIASTRIQYPFYKPYSPNVDLVEGAIDTIVPRTSYYSVDTTLVRFKREACEDFEVVNNIHIYRIDSTYAELLPIDHSIDTNAWLDPVDPINHHRSGHVHLSLSDSITKMGIESAELTGLPAGGNYVLMEMDYKCTTDIEIGLYIMSSLEGLRKKELYYLRPTSKWKKAYINFSPTVTDNYNATYFKFYMMSSLSGNSDDFYFDNIKLIYIDN